MSSYDLGPYFCENQHHALLHRVLDCELYTWGTGSYGIALEFGVGNGDSLRCISRKMQTVGFDSFAGLPEDWREGFPAGSFADRPVTMIPDNTALVEGLFEDTLPKWFADKGEGLRTIGLIHIDCDLYSSTKTVLENVMPVLLRQPQQRGAGCCIVFDEWHGYPGCERHEQRAWKEFVEECDLRFDWDVIGHGHQQWAVRIK